MKFNFTQENIKDLEAKGYVKSHDHYMHIVGKYFPNDNRPLKEIMKHAETDPMVSIELFYNLGFDIVYLNNCYCTTEEGAKIDQQVLKCAKQLVEDCKKYKRDETLRNMFKAAYRYLLLMGNIIRLGCAEEC